MYSPKYRTLMGNVCLALFLAFMFMLNPFTLLEARVLAAPSVEFGRQEVTVGGSGRITVPITITPLTSQFSGTVQVTLEFRDESGSSIGEGVYQTSTQTVYRNAYQIILDLVYYAPSSLPEGTVLRLSPGSVTVDAVVYVVVYLDEVQTPPPQPPSPPVPGPEVGGPSTSVGTETGWISVNPLTGLCTGYVDPDLAREIMAQAPPEGVTLLDIGKMAQDLGKIPENVIGNIPGSVFETADSMGLKAVLLDLGHVEMSGGPKAFLSEVLKAQGPLTTLKITSETLSQEDTQKTLDSLTGDLTENLKAASRFQKVSFFAVPLTGGDKEIKDFNGKITFGFLYDPDLVENPKHLNVYERGSLRYVGGKVDLGNTRALADLSGFNTGEFIVMEHTKTFTDVPKGYWGKEDIELMASKYVVDGMTKTTFEPESLVTRAQFVTMLVRSLGISEEGSETATFSDVAPGSWYYGYVEAAFKKGLAQGDSGKGGPFRPQDEITREEMAALLVRAMQTLGYSRQAPDAQKALSLLSAFNDGQSVSAWAQLEMAQAIEKGLVKGRDGNLIVPKGNGKRAEAATMMSRFMTQIGLL